MALRYKKTEKYISKQNLKKVLERLLEDTDLVAPVNVEGEIVFQEVDSVRDIIFDYENCLNAAKDYVLLNEEAFFEKKKQPSRPVVIFGSRACDTQALGLLDRFFSRKFEDPIYFNKRKNLLIITLACKKLGSNCFCTSVSSGPYLDSGFDVQLVELRDGYFLEAFSPEGKAFVKKFSGLISRVSAENVKSKKNAVKKAIESKEKEFDLKKVYDNLDKSNTRDAFWADLSQRCQSCGGCLLICPTCSCFYVVDKKFTDKGAERLRSLDACYYEGFTRMGEGLNPVSTRPEMMKRKFYHKLWQQVREFGQPGCTGCGRCNNICPGNVNWLTYIKRIEKVV